MSLLKIRTYPDDILRKKCEPVKEVKKQERKLFENMLDTMVKAAGVGLAASQVGEGCRIFVALYENSIYKVANPVIVSYFGTDSLEEGCLSVPERAVSVERFFGVTVRGVDENGEDQEIRATGMLARIFQHEIDHLNGVLILDHM